MNLSVIIPCYNEVSSIEQVVQSVMDVIGNEGEIIIVDDCSTDGTREILKNNIDGKLARVIYQEVNQGKGAALRVGFAAAGRNPDIKIGHVQYIDLSTTYAGVNDAFWRKRKSFEHEREVRALTLDFHSTEPGKLMPCDISLLIQEVFVSPKAPAWFIALVNDINSKYGLELKVSNSALIEEPFF